MQKIIVLFRVVNGKWFTCMVYTGQRFHAIAMYLMLFTEKWCPIFPVLLECHQKLDLGDVLVESPTDFVTFLVNFVGKDKLKLSIFEIMCLIAKTITSLFLKRTRKGLEIVSKLGNITSSHWQWVFSESSSLLEHGACA